MNQLKHTIHDALNYINKQKQNGQNNNTIIKQLIQKGFKFQTIFDAMDKIYKGEKIK